MYEGVQTKELKGLTIDRLKSICRYFGIKGYSDKTKMEIVDLIKNAENWKNRVKVEGASLADKPKHTVFGGVQTDIWVQDKPLSKTDDLTRFSKDDLMKMYNDVAERESFDKLTTTWRKVSKEKLIETVKVVLDHDFEMLPPKRADVSTIPKIETGTVISVTIPTENEITLFGSVLSQKDTGYLEIQIYENVNLTDGSKPSSWKAGKTIFKAKPFPMADRWAFCTNFPEKEKPGFLEWKLVSLKD